MMPIVWLIPEAHRKKPEEGIYECPVYKTLTRSGKFIFSTLGKLHGLQQTVYITIPHTSYLTT